MYSTNKFDNECQISNTACSSLTCSNTGEVYGTIRPDILGISAEDLSKFTVNDTDKPKLNNGACELTFDKTLNMFVFDTLLTECGVEVGQIIDGEER